MTNKKKKSYIIIDDVSYDFSDPEYDQRILHGAYVEKLDRTLEG